MAPSPLASQRGEERDHSCINLGVCVWCVACGVWRVGPERWLAGAFISGDFVDFKLNLRPAGHSKFFLEIPGGRCKTQGVSGLWG